MSTNTLVKQISKSGKRRQGHTYGRDHYGEPVTRLDNMPRKWIQVVVHEQTGRKRVDGKPAIHSRTEHIPDY